MFLLFPRAVLIMALLTPLSCRKGQSVLSKGSRPKGTTVRFVLDPTLVTRISHPFTSSTANQSVSPWVYRQECVASRVPRCLYHAHCLTSGCVHPQTGQEDLSLEAKPIHYQLLVLHRVPRLRHKPVRGRTSRRDSYRGKRYDFRLGSEVVSVGCTCVRPSFLVHH